ncbi:RHS repeat domain-containing protein [Flavobacterium crocinum]|uniref:RHS repeat domain-containing protein n=1 Tax=Flavobacterium crocinum TaxID=2183896 RepID=UPI001F0C4A3E|nr:RHS repeat-associated core domain-containing protein [Flavobacterium crocinum]
MSKWFRYHLGSTSYITTRNGSISQHVEYIAFGEVLFEEHSSSFSSSYLFNGKELDRETNLSYYSARYYDAKTSLWLNIDPLAEKMPAYGTYVFNFNNPVRFTDPTGLEGEDSIDPPSKKKDFDLSKQDGFYRRHGDYVNSDSKGFSGVTIGYNKEKKNFSTKSNVKLFNVEGKNVSGRYSKSLSAKARGIHGETKNRLGTEDFNIFYNAEGSVLYAEATADNGILTGETGKYGFNFGGGAEAGAFKGEVNSGVTYFGFKMATTKGGCIECVGAAANVGIYFDAKKGNLVIKGTEMLGLEIGAKLGVLVEIPIVKITEKVVKTFNK